MQWNKLSKTQIILVCVFCAGVLLMLLPGGENRGDDAADKHNEALVLEERIAALIENTYSLKEVSVILTYDTNGEKITSNPASDSSDGDFALSYRQSEPFVISEKLPYVRGALISAKSIGPEQSLAIQRAVATLLGISTSKVNVIYSN